LSVYNTNFYYRLALGDGVVDRESYARQWRSSSTSSSSRVKQNEKMFQHQEEPIQNLMQSQHYIISMMQVTILKYAIFFQFSNNIA
jgi:hypothetical protein